MQISLQDVFHYFAARVYIQGVYARKGSNMRIARPLDTAFTLVQARLNTIARQHGILDFMSKHRMLDVHRLIYFKIGSEDEQILSLSFQDILTVLGEAMACDEKLFHFTGKSGIVSKVPNKPARIGIWHYQMVVYLDCGLTYIVYSKAHVTTALMGMKTQTCEIVKQWSDIVISRHECTTLIMDSYYLSAAGRQYMNEHGVKYVAALKSDRFKKVCQRLLTEVTQSGQTAIAYNNVSGEAAVLHWSLDANIGKKYVMSNAFRKFTGRTRKGSIPVYDYYNAGFSGCDQFNRAMHKRTWPFLTRKCVMGTDKSNGWNYLFTVVILNVWHLWINADPENRKPVSYNNFCQALASSLVTSRAVFHFEQEQLEQARAEEQQNEADEGGDENVNTNNNNNNGERMDEDTT